MWLALDVGDPATRAACLARLLSQLVLIDPERILDEADGTHRDLHSELRRTIDDVIKSTAEPHKALGATLTAIAECDLELAIATACRFNAYARRDAGLVYVLASLVGREQVELGGVEKVIGLITDPMLRESAIKLTLLALAEGPKLEGDALLNVSLFLSSVSAESSCATIAGAIEVATKHLKTESPAVLERLLRTLDAKWNDSPENWVRIEEGFGIASRLAKVDPSVAERYLESSKKLKGSVGLDTKLRAETYELCVSLSVRAFGGLVKAGRETSSNLADIKEAIESIASRVRQVRAWSELALRFDLAERMDECRKIRDRQINPLLDEAKVCGALEYMRCLAYAAPVLFRCGESLALEQMGAMRQPFRDRALFDTARFLLSRIPPNDACQAPLRRAYEAPYERIIETLRIAELLDSDSRIYTLVADVAATAAGQKKPLNREQKKLLARRIRDLANRKFPAPGYVPHIGYRLVSLAQALALDGGDEEAWEELAAQASEIPNESDAAFVLLTIAGRMPTALAPLRKTLAGRAKERAAALGSILDRYHRLLDLAEEFVEVDRGISKDAINAATDVFRSSRIESETPRRLVDVAHRVDATLAAKLAESLDDDPARAESRMRLREEVKTLELASGIRKADLGVEDNERLSSAAWIALGDLNSGRSVAVAGAEIWKLVERAAQMPLQSSYPILSLAFTSAARQFAGTEESASYLRAIFDGAVTAARVTRELAFAQKDQRSRAVPSLTSSRETILVDCGERNRALEWLEMWCSENAQEKLVICDPYFEVEDLEALRLVGQVAGGARVTILTSKYALRRVAHPHEETFRTFWKDSISTSDPPETEVLAIGLGAQGTSPVHDRWWLTPSQGVKMGTSFGGLGKKLSSIVVMSPEEHAETYSNLMVYLERRRVVSRGEKVEYAMFSL